jgi:hypothetical protein
MTPSPAQPRTHPSRWLLPLLLAAPFMAQLDATIANVATPAIHTDLHASGSMLQLVIGGYLIAFAMLLITGARLGYSWGYRNLYIGGMALFSIASLACGLAPSAAVLVVTRVCQGTGAAMMLPQSLSGIQINFTGQGRMRAIGLYAAALSGGAITGQILGGVLVSANIAGSLWRTRHPRRRVSQPTQGPSRYTHPRRCRRRRDALHRAAAHRASAHPGPDDRLADLDLADACRQHPDLRRLSRGGAPGD